jgi:CHAT domain-containing protein/tetratricopeptide (TPR) repeat protein
VGTQACAAVLFLALGPSAAAQESPVPWTGEVARGETRTHRLDVPAGAYATLSVERGRGEVAVRLLDPAGTAVRDAQTSYFPTGSLRVSIVAAAGGAYRIEVTPIPGVESAQYAITADGPRPATPADAARVVAETAYHEGERLRIAATKEALAQAREAYSRAVERARGRDALLEGDALIGLARVQDALGDKPGALAGYRDALARHRGLDRPKAVAYLLNFIGLVQDHLGDRPAALATLTDALAASVTSGDLRVRGVTLNNFGLIHTNLGNRAEALRYYEEALPLHRAAGNPKIEANTLAGIGSNLERMGEYRRAFEHYERALPLSTAAGDLVMRGAVLNNMGTASFELDETEAALRFYGQALEVWRTAGERTGEAATLHNMAKVHAAAGEYQTAIALYEQARPLFKVTSSTVREANNLTSLGNLYLTLGDRDRALALFESVLGTHRAAGNRDFEARTLTDIGLAHASRGAHDRAFPVYERALALRREMSDRAGESATLLELGRSWLAVGDAVKALECEQRALVLAEAVGSGWRRAAALVEVGRARHALGETARGVADVTTAAALYRELRHPRGEAHALYALAHIEAGRGDLPAARAHVESAIELVESLRARVASPELRSSFLASVQDYFELHVDILMRLHRQHPGQALDGLALQTSERARARSLLDILAEASAGIREGVDPGLLARERKLRQALNAKAARAARLLSAAERDEVRVARAGDEIDVLAAELRTVQADIRAKSPRYAALTQPRPVGLEEIQQGLLDDRTVLLEYALGAERSRLWAVTRRSIDTFELPARRRLEALARRVAEEAKAPSAARSRAWAAADELGPVLLGPAARLLRGRRIVVVPDGALQYVPFAALPQAAGGRPLVLDHEVVTLPSASALAVLRAETAGRPAAPRLLAVLADPVFDDQDPRVRAGRKDAPALVPASLRDEPAQGPLPRLLGSRREALGILALAPEGAGWPALDFQASRKTATSGALADFRIVHFATHGVLDNARPELSGVVLSLVDEAGRPQDGFLRLHDVYNLELRADLVVLSACQTALGPDVRGEGLIGLTRGFMYAGARRVVTTLWRVDDRATAELMRRFYREMFGPRAAAPAAALRAAQASMASEARWADPYYWAGFVVQGDWR